MYVYRFAMFYLLCLTVYSDPLIQLPSNFSVTDTKRKFVKLVATHRNLSSSQLYLTCLRMAISDLKRSR
jgi:hypothetical protein